MDNHVITYAAAAVLVAVGVEKMQAGNFTTVSATVPTEQLDSYYKQASSTSLDVINSINKIKEKISNLKKLKKSSFIETLPSNIAEDTSLKIIDFFKCYAIPVNNAVAMADGGISLDFFMLSCHYSIDIYNDGDIVYAKRPAGKDSIIKDLTLEEVKEKLSYINPYGD
jgi:hypothetical protein